jgi:aromatic ring hydroxylase
MLLLRETVALMGGSESVIHVHAEGSMEASVIELYRSYDFKESKKMVEDLLAEMK